MGAEEGQRIAEIIERRMQACDPAADRRGEGETPTMQRPLWK